MLALGIQDAPIRSPIPQPYQYVSGGSFTGKRVPQSPDPLVAYRWENPKAADDLQIYVLRPKAVVATPRANFAGTASLLGNTPNLEVKAEGVIRLDFGVECAAWIEFDSPDCPGDVEMSISEYNEPGVNKTIAPQKIGNTYRLKLNDELYDGVRFAWIKVKSAQKPWHITGVRAVCQVKPTNYQGSFSCSDPMLTKIWYMSAYGVKASLCKDYFGAILMERGDRISWTGDAHPSQAAALVAFGNYDFIKKNLENTSQQDNGIRSYALYWVLSVLDYYHYTGDAEALKSYIDNATKKLESAYKVFGTNPGLSFYGWDERVGAGFEIWFRPNTESQDAYKMLSIRVWREFAMAMAQVGRPDLHDKFMEYANSKMAEVQREAGWHSSFGIHAAADAVNTGLLDTVALENLYNREFSDRVNRLSISPFNQYFILQAQSRLGKWDDALTSVGDMWGGMVNYGGTTTFEVYRPSWNSIIGKNDAVPNAQCGIVSLCHPWGAGVVKWLSEDVLGISPTSPGFATYDIKPHLGSTLTQVSGTTPTTHGDISASFDLAKGTAHVSAPKGTIGRIGLPKTGRTIKQVLVNGKLVWDGQFHLVPGIKGGREDSEFLFLNGLDPGSYSLSFLYEGVRPKPKPQKEVYAARVSKQDRKTSGNWGGKYGRDGYVLCGYLGDGKDKMELPSYVDSLDFFRAFPKAGRPDTTVWSSSTTDGRALASDRESLPSRTASCLSNSDQTMSLAINVKDRQKHRFTLYFVDWKKQGIRSGVEILDAATLKLIAPVSMVKDHGNGVYLTFEYDRSVKLRFVKVRGELVTLSGIFFD